MAARKPKETIAMTAVTEAVNSIGSSFRTRGRSIPSVRPLLERRFPFCTAQPLFGAVRAKQRRQRVPVRRSEHDFFFGGRETISNGRGGDGKKAELRGLDCTVWPLQKHNPGAVMG